MFVFAAKSRTLWQNDDFHLVRECQRILFDGSCVPGYDAVVVFSHSRSPPPGDVIDEMMAAVGDCFNRDDLEVLSQQREWKRDHD